MGVPSCFSGGRRMVKCTRSTLASDLRRLRQVRSPACGSPDTSRTRSLSRTPSIETTARLLTPVSSPSSGDASISTMFGPAWGICTLTLALAPTRTLRFSIVSPSRRTVTCAGPGGAPWSSTRKVMVCACPTMPKRGAVVSTTRRSRSFLWPVISPCTGAAKPSAAASLGTSCTRPSVMKRAPATRSCGTSDSAEDSAANSRVPSVSPSAWPASTKRTSMPGMRPSRSASAARTASVCFMTVAEFLARALVDDHDRNRGQRVAVFARDRGIGEREHEQCERDGADQRAAGAAEHDQQRNRERNDNRRPDDIGGNERRK